MLERRKEKRELPDRFEQTYIERRHYQRVMRILRSVADGQPITKDDLVWLARKGKSHWTDKLRKAHHENMARILSGEWHQTKDVWKAINACGAGARLLFPKWGCALSKEHWLRHPKRKRHTQLY